MLTTSIYQQSKEQTVTMENKSKFLARLRESSSFSRKYYEKSKQLRTRIRARMSELEWNQQDLAREMGKSEAEISKWLSGLHNFTWKSILKLEVALECELVEISKEHSVSAILIAEPWDFYTAIAPESKEVDFHIEGRVESHRA